MATMEDIARHLGISKGTVSKALSGAQDVSESMRHTVLEAAVELGYTRVSRVNAAPKICIFIENMEYTKPEDFGWALVTGFRKSAEPAGFAVDIIPLSESLQNECSYDEFMLKHDYRGSFFLGVNFFDPWLKDFSTSHTPAVLFDNKVTYNPSTVYVGVNNTEGFDLAVRHLKELGHTTIGYLSSSLGSYVYQDRYRAFFQALQTNGLNDDSQLAGDDYFSSECVHRHLPRLLDLGCTAILCSHDTLAQTALIYCSEKGIPVPGALSIIGFDDLPICEYTNPPLSSIRQDRNELGKSAFYALSAQINRIHIDSLTLHPELILRTSVGPVPVKS